MGLDLGLDLGEQVPSLGPPVVPFSPLFLRQGSPTKMDYRKKGTLILTSMLEDLVVHLSHLYGQP